MKIKLLQYFDAVLNGTCFETGQYILLNEVPLSSNTAYQLRNSVKIWA